MTTVIVCFVVGLITFTVGFVLGVIAAKNNPTYVIDETDPSQHFGSVTRLRSEENGERATHPQQPSVYEMSNHVARMFETKAR